MSTIPLSMREACLAALSIIATAVPAQSQRPTLAAQRIYSIDASKGGPERIPGALAVGRDGRVAFTFGYDNADRHVTVMDSTGRVVARVGQKGAGPGEFQAVLNVFLDRDRVLLFGAGQLSAFAPDGKHLWSRAMPPTQLAVGFVRDSVDLMEASHFADGRGVGSVFRQSTALGGGARKLIDGQDAQVRGLARSVDDSSRFPRLAFASAGDAVVIGHAHTYQLLALSASGTDRRPLGPKVGVKRRSAAEVEGELARQVARASRPFKLPDGTTRQNPVNRIAIRSRLQGPVPYFSVRGGGLQVDGQTGDIFVVETPGDSVRVVRYTRTGSAATSIACDARDGSAALAWPFLALTCAATESSEGGPTLRLFRLR